MPTLGTRVRGRKPYVLTGKEAGKRDIRGVGSTVNMDLETPCT